ncbi:MAG: tRNA 5-methoxyuridine(34)/uridine 5-oxyacetic acid(34) synthase CmoB [Gammaproteobacteria bacterium]|nr:tRNA 5-methoxyuridine(34)/uridine 5-oxyacetic acid(34) synthase CmoB [Gammaproteobacteria bacterium]
MSMESLYKLMEDSDLEPWRQMLPAQLLNAYDEKRHGNLMQWRQVLAQLPKLDADTVLLDQAQVEVQSHSAIDANVLEQTRELLQQLCPWRKGPYKLHGIHIDTEWRSDWKWQRVAPHLSNLQGRRILDVGCGSGYHAWRMAGAGAELVIGIDPSILFAMQFAAIKHFIGDDYPIYMLPLGIEQVPAKMRAFDTVFSMGVLYHRRSPIDHLVELRDCLRAGGELVLETLVIEGQIGESLMPEERYAKMRNVWFIPTIATLELWLRRCGYRDIRVVDVSRTSFDEQRRTGWMQFESLQDFLDEQNPELTVEGYPAPLRATIVASVP